MVFSGFGISMNSSKSSVYIQSLKLIKRVLYFILWKIKLMKFSLLEAHKAQSRQAVEVLTDHFMRRGKKYFKAGEI